MTAIVNGLPVTRTRLALTQAIAEGRGRIYYEPAAKTVWDHRSGMRVTARVEELLRHGWIRALGPDEPRAAGESKLLVHYRLTDLGRVAMNGEA